MEHLEADVSGWTNCLYLANMVPLLIIVRSIAKVNPAASFFDCADIRFIILHPLQRASAVHVDIKR